MKNTNVLKPPVDVLGFGENFYRKLKKSLQEMLRMDKIKKVNQEQLDKFADDVTKKIYKDPELKKGVVLEIKLDQKTKIKFKLRLSALPINLFYTFDKFSNNSLNFDNFIDNEIPRTVKKLIKFIKSGKKI